MVETKDGSLTTPNWNHSFPSIVFDFTSLRPGQKAFFDIEIKYWPQVDTRKVVKRTLTAEAGTWDFGAPYDDVKLHLYSVQTPSLCANLTLPGAVIDAKVGDTIVIDFHNENPDSDDEEDNPSGTPATATLHPHGSDVPDTSDGTVVTQEPVLKGESYLHAWIAIREGTKLRTNPHVTKKGS